jgi:hypothetical protein
MKRTLSVILAFTFISIFCVSPVLAATSQGLEWGVADGHRVDYTMTSDDDEIPNEDLYIEVDDMPSLAIPDPLTTWAAIPDGFDLSFYWANDTSMGITTLIFIGLLAVGSKFVVPIGNWTLLQSLLAPVLTGETFIGDAYLWGLEWSEDVTSTEEFKVTATYLKSDGFLAEYKLETWSTSNDSRLASIEIVRTDIPAGGDILQLIQDNLLIVGAGVAVILIIGIVICKRR